MREYKHMFKKIKQAILDVNASNANLESNKTLVAGVSALAAGAISSPIVLASSKGGGIPQLFGSLGKLLQQVFTGVDSIMTSATVVVIGLGFLIRIFSKNQRTVDEATTWIKRAVLTLITWKFLGLFLDTINGAAKGNEYKWK